MADPDTISFAVLNGPAIGELRNLIVSAFEPEELEQLLKIKMNKKLDAIVIQNSPMNTLVYDLLEAVNRDGQITLLLRVVSEAKPHRPDLRKAIEAHCPQALEAPLLGVQAQAVVTGLGDLQSQVESNPTVRNVIAASRDKLEQLRNDVDVLFNYKMLHDCLHTIQLREYPNIIDKAKQFRTDPLASADLETNILELKDICGDARGAAGSLPDEAAVRGQEMQWVAKLESAVTELSKALDDLDDHGAARAARSIRRVIRKEPFRINMLLTIVAQKLPLDELAQTIENVISAIATGGASPLELQDALRSLKNILPQLRGRVAEHRQWQEIENDFWDADDCIERKTPDSVEEFTESWPSIKSRVDSLARTEPESDWAKATRRQAALIDADLASDVDSAMKKFEYFRRTALFHFYQVDKALKAQCAEILKIRAPLRSLLDKV
jgi:hypothetical protein